MTAASQKVEAWLKISESATQGFWSIRQSGMFEDSYAIKGIVRSHNHTPYVCKPDAEHIAAMCPANAQALMKSWLEMREAITDSIARSNDYGDSYCSQPIRKALRAADAAILGTGEK